MKKSTYSVVLSDRVVAEIDRLAYRKGTNRSSMINEILAGYVSMTTPEQRISRIFSDMAAVLYPGEVFRELAPPTPSVMSMRAALAYKYNPTVRYTVELFRDPGATHGGAQGLLDGLLFILPGGFDPFHHLVSSPYWDRLTVWSRRPAPDRRLCP